MGIMGSDSDDRASLFADINVTPLVDVMLVLLIIFMVTAPFMIETIGVTLPQGEGAQSEGQTTPLTISIDSAGKIVIAGQTFTQEELKQFLSESPRVKSGEGIYLEADKAISHGMVTTVMSIAHSAGANKINIMMEKL